MVLPLLKESLWQQFGASIDMLRNAIVMWPEEKWENPRTFFDMSYHTVFFLDYYLTNPPEDFKPPLAYILLKDVPDDRIDDIFPERIYTKEEILGFLEYCRKKCKSVIDNITEENINTRWTEPGKDFLMLELLMYNMRHVQHHAAQMNIMLRKEIGNAPRWVSKARV